MQSSDLTIPSISPEYAERLKYRKHSKFQHIWSVLDCVCDPELPGLTIWDLGILVDVQANPSGWLIVITLTYSGCPAVNIIKQDIQEALKTAGISVNVAIEVALSPAWSTDAISPNGRKQLRDLSIAPPSNHPSMINCPICNSNNTSIISEFGSTACKALYRCNDCLEPFDYFKPF